MSTYQLIKILHHCWKVMNTTTWREDDFMWKSMHVYAWCAKWVMGLRKKKNMATLTPQFKIKHGLEQEEFVRVAYAIFSK